MRKDQCPECLKYNTNTTNYNKDYFHECMDCSGVRAMADNGYSDTWLDEDDFRYSCKIVIVR